MRCYSVGQFGEQPLGLRLGAMRGRARHPPKVAPDDRDALDELAEPLQAEQDETEQDEPLRRPDQQAAGVDDTSPDW